MKRHTRVFGSIGLFLGTWILLMTETIALPDCINNAQTRSIIPAIPYLALCVFGCYSLAKIGFGLATFPECPDANAELQHQIIEAKVSLQKRGIKL
eukprot:ANDGO_00688.mRNA.1 Dolichol-phosphate mannosyltransferase subunit 3